MNPKSEIQLEIKSKIHQISKLINEDINNNSIYTTERKNYLGLLDILDNTYNEIFTELNYGLAWRKDLSHSNCHTGSPCKCFNIYYMETDISIIYKISSCFYYNTEHTVKFDKETKKLIYVGNIKTNIKNNMVNYFENNINVEMEYKDIIRKILNLFK